MDIWFDIIPKHGDSVSTRFESHVILCGLWIFPHDAGWVKCAGIGVEPSIDVDVHRVFHCRCVANNILSPPHLWEHQHAQHTIDDDGNGLIVIEALL